MYACVDLGPVSCPPPPPFPGLYSFKLLQLLSNCLNDCFDDSRVFFITCAFVETEKQKRKRKGDTEILHNTEHNCLEHLANVFISV